MRIDSTALRSLLAAALAGTLAGCDAIDNASDEEGEADEIASALEQENGGLTMDDEAPLFADEDSFAAAELEGEIDFADPLDGSPEVDAALAAEGAVVYHAAVLWGQMPPDFDAEIAVNWSGTLSINRGAMLIRRVVAFEDATDSVERRDDPRTIRFTSRTRPHVDGFRLTLIDPEPGSNNPLVLTYDPAEGRPFSVAVDALLEGPQADEVDDTGNRLVAVAFREPADPCNHGFLRGRWHRVRDGRGRLYGQVTDAEGELVGHMRGVYGQRRDGSNVFFGKYIDREGRFRGLFGGNYRDNHFHGRWIVRGEPDHGVLGGEFRENRRARGIGGHFLGRWAEKSCNVDLDR